MASRTAILLLLVLALTSVMVVEARGKTQSKRTGECTVRNRPAPQVVDYIVLGGGTAGSIVASRLSENPHNTVLVIEAGGDNTGNPFTLDPGNWATVGGSPLDWADIVALGEPRIFQDLQKRHITSGRTLGGSSAINSAMFVRSPATFDRWAAAGNAGWSYNDVLPFFKGLETSPRFASNPLYHGNSGALHTQGAGVNADAPLVNAALASGLTYVNDWNGAAQITSPQGSVGFEEKTTVNGVRQNSFQTFIKPNLCRPNLYVMDRSSVLRINFDNHKRARSVSWVDNVNAKLYTTKARKEIVLSLGTVRTSQILRLSGVGNATELTNLGVDVVANRPGVGQNLQDHPIHVINIISPSTNDATCNHDSLITSNLWIRTALQDAADPRPDIQVIAASSCSYIFLPLYVLNPRSRGSVELFSNDPAQRAGVHINFFQDQRDLDTMIAGVRKIAEIYTHLGGFVNTYDVTDTNAITNFILGNPFARGDVNSGLHLVGTAKMGPASDPMAVVDSRLRVYGVTGLRVADASIMPEIPSGNTQCPTYVIGAKAAAMILEDN